MSETGMFHGLDGLDRKMLGFIDFDGGYFVEVGANDGVAQSNTLYRMTRYLEARAASIAGGSDGVQRNIIAKHVLKL